MRRNKALERAGITGTLTLILVAVIVRLFDPDILVLLPIAGMIGFGSAMIARFLTE